MTDVKVTFTLVHSKFYRTHLMSQLNATFVPRVGDIIKMRPDGQLNQWFKVHSVVVEYPPLKGTNVEVHVTSVNSDDFEL